MLRSPRFPIVLAGLALLASPGLARAQSGATLVFVSHDMRLAAGFDTVLSLQDFAPAVQA